MAEYSSENGLVSALVARLAFVSVKTVPLVPRLALVAKLAQPIRRDSLFQDLDV
jgi:hypothetical protein